MPNVSERNRTMQALRESERRYRVVIETASDAIVTIDENDISPMQIRRSKKYQAIAPRSYAARIWPSLVG